MNELSAIPVGPDHLNSLRRIVDKYDVHPHIYENLDAWADDSNAQHKDLALRADGDLPSPPGAEAEEQCMLLVGPIAEMVERKLPELVNKVNPGLPVVAACESPRLSDVVRLIQLGARDVVNLASDDQDVRGAIESALDYGRQTEAHRLRIIELRQRLATVTKGERQVLDAMLEGLANKETAKKLGIGLRTVELRRAKIMMKMGAKGVAELVKLFCEARCPGVDTRAVQ